LPGATGKYKADLKDYHPAVLAAANPVPMRSYPKLNHLFVAGEGRRTPEEYRSDRRHSELDPRPPGGAPFRWLDLTDRS